MPGIVKEVSPDTIAKASKDTVQKVVLTHTDPKRTLEDTDKVIEEHNLYDCGCIFAYKLFNLDSFMSFADDFAAAADALKEIIADIQKQIK